MQNTASLLIAGLEPDRYAHKVLNAQASEELDSEACQYFREILYR